LNKILIGIAVSLVDAQVASQLFDGGQRIDHDNNHIIFTIITPQVGRRRTSLTIFDL
jgi:hypothetical protein